MFEVVQLPHGLCGGEYYLAPVRCWPIRLPGFTIPCRDFLPCRVRVCSRLLPQPLASKLPSRQLFARAVIFESARSQLLFTIEPGANQRCRSGLQCSSSIDG